MNLLTRYFHRRRRRKMSLANWNVCACEAIELQIPVAEKKGSLLVEGGTHAFEEWDKRRIKMPSCTHCW